MAATLAAPLTASRRLRVPRRVDPSLWVGGGLAVLSAVGVLVVLNQVVPTQQEVLQVVRDLPAVLSVEVQVLP